MEVRNSAAYQALGEIKRMAEMIQDIMEESVDLTKTTAMIRNVIAQASALATTFKLMTGISITSTLTLEAIGATGQIVTTFTPSDASNQGMNFVSSDTTKATVDETGLVTVPLLATSGSSTITGTSSDGAFTDTCTVTVTIS